MDITKQIIWLLILLGVVLITPPTLRYFHVDAKTVYRKILFLDDKDTPAQVVTPRDGLVAVEKKQINPNVFNELFQEPSAETPAQRETAKQEFEKMIVGLQEIEHTVGAAVSKPSEQSVVGVPMPFRHEKGAENKVRWLPPPPGFLTAETFSYLIYREGKPVEPKLKEVLGAIHGNLMLDLTPFTLVSKPNKILVMLFDSRNSYMNYTKRPAWSGAASDLRADTMYVLEGPNFYPLSVHELTHLYFDGYFLPTISPLWLSEGMAVYMQIYATHKRPGWVDPGIKQILSGQYIDLEELMQMEDLSALSTEEAELWYTQAFSIVDYLLNARSRDEFYRFCNELKAGTPTYLALYRAYGMPFNKISVLQNVWLYDLTRKMGRQAGNERSTVSTQVLSSTQTIRVPLQQAPRTTTPQPVRQQKPQQTVIPKLKMVETNGYKGYF